MPKTSAKKAARKTRRKAGKAASKTAGKATKVATERSHQPHRTMTVRAEPARYAGLPDTMREVTERNLAQTRELYELSKHTVEGILQSWQKTFGAVALNRRVVELADRNIDNTFRLATGLAGAKNLTEVMELHAEFSRKQFVDRS